MGRSTFTRDEFQEIQRLLREKGTADRDRQKAIRAKLRRAPLEFHISGFTDRVGGFVASDLDDLVRSGRITVSD
jgi:hypothetical protein